MALNRQDLEVGKSASEATSFILCSIPETLCYGLVKLRMLKVLMISLLQHLQQENRYRTSTIFASGLGKILTGNFKKQITTAEGKAQSEKRILPGRQIPWMIYDVFQMSGDHEAILDFRDLSTVQLKHDNVQAFDTKWDEVYPQSLTDLLYTQETT